MPRDLISHPDKVFFAERGETKGDLAEHYVRVAEPLMRAMGGRPVLLQRFPDGASGPSFFQKRVPKNIPDWLQTTVVSTPNGTTSQALIAADIDHVLWAVNLGCLGFHVWPYLAADPEHADELRIDLDPSPGVDFTHIRRAAHEADGLLTELGLAGHPKTTGNPQIVLRKVALCLAALGEEHLVRMADQVAWHCGSPPRLQRGGSCPAAVHHKHDHCIPRPGLRPGGRVN